MSKGIFRITFEEVKNNNRDTIICIWHSNHTAIQSIALINDVVHLNKSPGILI